MEQPTRDLEPWEVPPDEAYWQALLREGEYGEGTALLAGTWGPAVAAGGRKTGGLGSPPEPQDAGAPEQVASPHTVADPAPLSGPQDPEPLRARVEAAAVSPAAPVALPGVDEDSDAGADAADDPAHAEHEPAGEPGCWEVFAEHQAEGHPLELTVEGYNRGGLLVRWMGVMGFVPASQLCDGLRYGDERSRLDDLSDRVGGTLTVRVIEVDASKNRLIFSERAARHIEDPDLSVLESLNAGDVCRGLITNLCTFGAFVDLGGVEGLIHISELSWGRVGHPSDVLSSGQEVEVYVLNVDREQGRVGLSLKRLQPDPWDNVEARYEIDQVVEGTITNIVNFGAFVRLEEGLEGLIHASELTGGMMPSLYALREGEHVLVRINSIEGARHRIGLSLEHL
jgi:small subunit ribosomal protein S1